MGFHDLPKITSPVHERWGRNHSLAPLKPFNNLGMETDGAPICQIGKPRLRVVK